MIKAALNVQYKHTYVNIKQSIYTVGEKGNSGLNNLRMDFSYKIIIPVYGKVALWDTKIF